MINNIDNKHDCSQITFSDSRMTGLSCMRNDLALVVMICGLDNVTTPLCPDRSTVLAIFIGPHRTSQPSGLVELSVVTSLPVKTSII